MADPKTYEGGCHCGNVRYQVTTELDKVASCNCSICSKTGTLLAFVPAESFKLLSGEGELTDYQFNKNVIHHLFCRRCGVRSFMRGSMPDGKPMVAVNVRCLDDVDTSGLTPMQFDGKSL